MELDFMYVQFPLSFIYEIELEMVQFVFLRVYCDWRVYVGSQVCVWFVITQ